MVFCKLDFLKSKGLYIKYMGEGGVGKGAGGFLRGPWNILGIY